MATDGQASRLRQNANWRRLWLAQAISIVGDFVFNTTVVLWVGVVIAAGRSWAPAAVGGVLLATGVPVLLVGPLAGVYVDRWNRRRVMMAADLLRAAFIAVLLIIPAVGSSWPVGLQLALVYGLVALTSAASQFFNPARFVVIAAVVAEPDQPRAFGLATATTSAAAVLGPPLAAPLLFTAGVHWALIIDSASYLVSFALTRIVRLREDATPAADASIASFWKELGDGLRYFARNRVLIVITATISLYMLGVGAINVLNVFFVTNILGVPARWLGTLEGAFGIGSILGALVAGWVIRKLGGRRVYAYGFIVAGLAVLCYSRSGSLAVATGILALAGIPLACVNVSLGPLILSETPANMVGRINSVLNPLMYLSSILATVLAGFLASTVLHGMDAHVLGLRFRSIDTIFAGAAVMMIVAGIVAARTFARPEGAAQTTEVPEPSRVEDSVP